MLVGSSASCSDDQRALPVDEVYPGVEVHASQLVGLLDARDPPRYDMVAENRELTVMFRDMRNFTHVSELLAPKELRGLANSFFSTMTSAIREHRGTLDKSIGHAIVAFCGAPLTDPAHAANATRAARTFARLAALDADLRNRGLPQIGLGLGLNTGTVCVGDMTPSMGSSDTVMGDAVNLASRIEGLTRHHGVDLLVGEDTCRAVGEPVAVRAFEVWRWVEVDRVRVKGKRRPVTLFTPIVVAAERAPRSTGKCDFGSLHWPRTGCTIGTRHRPAFKGC